MSLKYHIISNVNKYRQVADIAAYLNFTEEAKYFSSIQRNGKSCFKIVYFSFELMNEMLYYFNM